MLKKNKLITLISFLTISLSAHSFECKSFNTRYVFNQKAVNKKENLCINTELTKASSKSCQFLKDKKCPFHSIVRKDKADNFVRQIGSPAYNLCHDLEGSPQVYEIEIKGKWLSFDRCFGKNSKEFADANDLYALYMAL